MSVTTASVRVDWEFHERYCTSINLNNFCNEQDLDVCATELHIQSYKICIATVYWSPTGDFIYFLNTLEKILNKIYNNSTDLILCGDFNVNYHINSSFMKSLDSLLTSYGISSVVSFSTRILKVSRTLIDNIFLKLSTWLCLAIGMQGGVTV